MRCQSSGIAPTAWLASTTRAAPASRALAPIAARSTDPPSVQWVARTATTATRSSSAATTASPQRWPSRRSTVTTSAPVRQANRCQV
jgi:hypothetical protein